MRRGYESYPVEVGPMDEIAQDEPERAQEEMRRTQRQGETQHSREGCEL